MKGSGIGSCGPNQRNVITVRARLPHRREELGSERANRGVVAPSEGVLGDQLAADANRRGPGVEHLAHIFQCDPAGGDERDIGKWPA